MLINPWFAVFIDRRGSLFIPAEVKRHIGVGVGESMAVRVLGPALVLLPVTYTLNWPADDRGRDFRLATILNDSWNGAAPAVMPPLFSQAAAPAAPAGPGEGLPEYQEGETNGLKGIEQLVYVNKKGFLPIPEQIKDLLGMSIGEPYMLEVQQKGSQPVLVVSPVNHKVSISAYLERKKQEHLQDSRLVEARAMLKAEIEQMEERLSNLQQQKKELELQVAGAKAKTSGTNLFAQLLGGGAKEEKTIASSQAASNPVPDHMNPNKPPTEALPPGQKWHFGGLGWVKVDDIDYVEPETK